MPYINDDWLCSRCGQVSNSSEPCHACDRKEREANPIPPPPPAPGLPIAYRSSRKQRQLLSPPPPPQPPQGPTRDSSRKSFEREPNRLWQAILLFIGWLLDKLVKTEKPKVKNTAEQMATLGELFEGYEDEPIHRERGTDHRTM